MADGGMKQVVHSQRGPRGGKGGYKPWHNDGSMYKSDKGRFGRYRKDNFHWDMFCGTDMLDTENWVTGGAQVGKTCEAVSRFYEATVRDEYNHKLESPGWVQHPDRVKTFEDYCDDKQHCLSETVVQTGDIDDPGDPACVLESTKATLKRMKEAGLTVIAVDFHLDEATPHAHILWTGVTEASRINVDGCLREHGVEKARPEPREIPTKKGGTRKETKKEYERRCTRLATLTERMRAAAEDAADAWLKDHGRQALDRERQGRIKGEALPDYRARRQREREAAQAEADALKADAVKERDEALEGAKTAKAEAEAAKTEAEAAKGEASTAKMEAEVAKREREEAREQRNAMTGERYTGADGKTYLGMAGMRKRIASAKEEADAEESRRDEARAQAEEAAKRRDEALRLRGLYEGEAYVVTREDGTKERRLGVKGLQAKRDELRAENQRLEADNAAKRAEGDRIAEANAGRSAALDERERALKADEDKLAKDRAEVARLLDGDDHTATVEDYLPAAYHATNDFHLRNRLRYTAEIRLQNETMANGGNPPTIHAPGLRETVKRAEEARRGYEAARDRTEDLRNALRDTAQRFAQRFSDVAGWLDDVAEAHEKKGLGSSMWRRGAAIMRNIAFELGESAVPELTEADATAWDAAIEAAKDETRGDFRADNEAERAERAARRVRDDADSAFDKAMYYFNLKNAGRQDRGPVR